MAVPLCLLTGFLGSGKTTLLARLLRDGTGERVAVLVNEVGELSLDHHLLERVDDDTVVLASGCVCCTMRGDLLLALERLVALDPERIVVETTGLADPAPIVHAMVHHPVLGSAIHVEQVVTVLDASRGEQLLDEEPEARRQLAVADRVVLTKTDMTPLRVGPLRERLVVEAPGADVLEAVHGESERPWLLPSASTPLSRASTGNRWLYHHELPSHDVDVRVLELGPDVDEEALWLWLRLVTQLDGRELLRVKGLVISRARGDVCVLQSAQHAVFPLRRLPPSADAVTRSALVVISRGLSPAVLARMEASAREAAAGTAWAATRPLA